LKDSKEGVRGRLMKKRQIKRIERRRDKEKH